jgi:hypothetical protein
LIAREIEKRGIVTVAFGLTRNHLEAVKPPRSLFIKWPFGNPLGEPGNRPQQRTLLFDALRMVRECTVPGTIRDLQYRWRRERYADPDFSQLG